MTGSSTPPIIRQEDKQQTHRHVPTWNYSTVHIRGRVTFSHGHKDKLAVVGKLTTLQEQTASGGKVWKMLDAPRDFMDRIADARKPDSSGR